MTKYVADVIRLRWFFSKFDLQYETEGHFTKYYDFGCFFCLIPQSCIYIGNAFTRVKF